MSSREPGRPSKREFADGRIALPQTGMGMSRVDQEFDVVVIGSGIGGLATALAAAEFGMKALVLEKHDKLGGGTAASHGGFWVGGNHLALAEGIEDSRDEILAYMRFIGGDEL